MLNCNIKCLHCHFCSLISFKNSHWTQTFALISSPSHLNDIHTSLKILSGTKLNADNRHFKNNPCECMKKYSTWWQVKELQCFWKQCKAFVLKPIMYSKQTHIIVPSLNMKVLQICQKLHSTNPGWAIPIFHSNASTTFQLHYIHADLYSQNTHTLLLLHSHWPIKSPNKHRDHK